jgi:hypothetical protein
MMIVVVVSDATCVVAETGLIETLELIASVAGITLPLTTAFVVPVSAKTEVDVSSRGCAGALPSAVLVVAVLVLLF